MDTAPSRITLLGRDHEVEREAVTATTLGGAAVGLARGWEPKPYPYVDPNEDAVAAATGRRAHLLVVADGHRGREASHAAVEAIVELFGADPRPADLGDDELVAAAGLVEQRISAVRRPDRRARTTLVVAWRTPSAVQWFGAGDSSLLAVGLREARDLPAQSRFFFGDRLDTSELTLHLARGVAELDDDEWLVLATDGYTDYPPDGLHPMTAAVVAVAGSDDARMAADALLDQARRGGAGDNVGVSISPSW